MAATHEPGARAARAGELPASDRRVTLAVHAVWALVPAGLVAWSRFTLLPGESWGFGFLALGLGLPLWALTGVVLWLTSALARPRRWANVALTPLALGLAWALVVAVGALPLAWQLDRPVRRAFACAELGGDVVRIEGDEYFAGYGAFVREDPATSTAARASLQSLGGPVLVPRRTTRLAGEDAPRGVDVLIAHPVQDGWWYVYQDY